MHNGAQQVRNQVLTLIFGAMLFHRKRIEYRLMVSGL